MTKEVGSGVETVGVLLQQRRFPDDDALVGCVFMAHLALA
jgi:hypothetical protein